MDSDKITILLVDDDEVDVRSIRRAFSKARISNPIVEAKDGVEALRVLRGEHEEKQIARPYLILLDVNMPKMNGLQFLKALRADKKLKDSVVFILTTSNDERDKAEAYDKHVAGYLVKSRAAESFLNHAKMVKSFLISVEFPPETKTR